MIKEVLLSLFGNSKTCTKFPIGTKVHLRDEVDRVRRKKENYIAGGMTWFGIPTVYIITGYDDRGYDFQYEGTQKPPKWTPTKIIIYKEGGWKDRDFVAADPDATNNLPAPPSSLNPIPVKLRVSEVI